MEVFTVLYSYEDYLSMAWGSKTQHRTKVFSTREKAEEFVKKKKEEYGVCFNRANVTLQRIDGDPTDYRGKYE